MEIVQCSTKYVTTVMVKRIQQCVPKGLLDRAPSFTLLTNISTASENDIYYSFAIFKCFPILSLLTSFYGG